MSGPTYRDQYGTDEDQLADLFAGSGSAQDTDMGERPDARPQFLRICWEIANEDGGGLVEATLCRDHRREIAHKYPSARGSRQLGDTCDACEGRQPKSISSSVNRGRVDRASAS
jgi:hypothetical protein